MNPDDPTIPSPRQTPPSPEEMQGLSPKELFARGLHTPAATGTTGEWTPPSPQKLAELLPQYHIESLIGRGGMGAVYKGLQPALERTVAIKLLPAEFSEDAEFIARFQREARMLAKLHHSGIVAIHDFGQTSAGHLYFVMEFVDGTDLAQIIRTASLTSAQILELTIQICDALHYAHSQGLIHRDIKPANILVTKQGRAKLADFGLARPVHQESGSLTVSDVVMGTTAYMAPEQREGHADHRADIYALGVLLYEMLTGKRPEGVFDPPSVKAHADVRLDTVVLKALQQEPDRRYQHVSEMGTDVEEIRTTPGQARKQLKVLKTERMKKPFFSRPRVIAAAIALVLAAVVAIPVMIVGGYLFWLGAKSPSTPIAKSEPTLGEPPNVAAPSAPTELPSNPEQPVAKPPTTNATMREDALQSATKEQPFINSLGMKFVPVPGTKALFCIHHTRKSDYRKYAEANSGVDGSWTTALDHEVPVSEGEDHPVASVSWEDAKGFCAWLSGKEARIYRLPTDHQWSLAVGIGDREDQHASPESKSKKIPDVFPWGTEWPPPKGAGNFADRTLKEKIPSWDKGIIEDYEDGYATTSPVMSFAPNKLGLYDMAGNVWQWCEDWIDSTHKRRVMRGGSWSDFERENLLSSDRNHTNPASNRSSRHGFRVVLVR